MNDYTHTVLLVSAIVVALLATAAAARLDAWSVALGLAGSVLVWAGMHL